MKQKEMAYRHYQRSASDQRKWRTAIISVLQATKNFSLGPDSREHSRNVDVEARV